MASAHTLQNVDPEIYELIEQELCREQDGN